MPRRVVLPNPPTPRPAPCPTRSAGRAAEGLVLGELAGRDARKPRGSSHHVGWTLVLNAFARRWWHELNAALRVRPRDLLETRLTDGRRLAPRCISNDAAMSLSRPLLPAAASLPPTERRARRWRLGRHEGRPRRPRRRRHRGASPSAPATAHGGRGRFSPPGAFRRTKLDAALEERATARRGSSFARARRRRGAVAFPPREVVAMKRIAKKRCHPGRRRRSVQPIKAVTAARSPHRHPVSAAGEDRGALGLKMTPGSSRSPTARLGRRTRAAGVGIDKGIARRAFAMRRRTLRPGLRRLANKHRQILARRFAVSVELAIPTPLARSKSNQSGGRSTRQVVGVNRRPKRVGSRIVAWAWAAHPKTRR